MNDEWFTTELTRLVEICEQKLAGNESIQGITCPYCGAELSKLLDNNYRVPDDEIRCPCCGLDSDF